MIIRDKLTFLNIYEFLLDFLKLIAGTGKNNSSQIYVFHSWFVFVANPNNDNNNMETGCSILTVVYRLLVYMNSTPPSYHYLQHLSFDIRRGNCSQSQLTSDEPRDTP